MWEYCTEHSATPKDLGDTYQDVREQLGLVSESADEDTDN